jgi:hypothetical protein
VIAVVKDELIHDFFEDELIPDCLTLSIVSESNTIKNGMTITSLLIHQTKYTIRDSGSFT